MNKVTIEKLAEKLDQEIELDRYDDEGKHKAKMVLYNPGNHNFIIKMYNGGSLDYHQCTFDIIEAVNYYNNLTLD